METSKLSFLSPIGNICITATREAVKSISFADEDSTNEENILPDFQVLEDCKKQLIEYFSGQRKQFSILTDPDGTDFQKKVWKALTEVPYGKTAAYGELAGKLGDKNLMRAVGGANGKNPIAIIVPCHRVIGTSGTLTGYAGGLWRKKWLLDLEQPEKQTFLF